MFLRISFMILALLLVGIWFSDDLSLAEIDAERRGNNLRRFLHSTVPYPVRQGEGPGSLLPWVLTILRERGWEACGQTLAISAVAIVISGILACLSLPLASRNLAVANPFLYRNDGAAGRRFFWGACRGLTRFLLIASRSIPDYILAFLLISALGLNAWPAVLALSIHNAGILGRLGSEMVENTPREIPTLQRALGASRLKILIFGLFPMVFPRFLVFFFYRWETCIRDATVLGTLGIASLGYWIQDAHVRQFYNDEMMFFVGLSALLVIAGDLLSILVRGWLRRHG